MQRSPVKTFRPHISHIRWSISKKIKNIVAAGITAFTGFVGTETMGSPREMLLCFSLEINRRFHIQRGSGQLQCIHRDGPRW